MNSNSVLLPDETHCRSELGGILYRERKAYAFSAEVLSVSEPESFFGHVEYEIGILMEPIDASNYESRRFDLTTRFRCLNKLYQQLSTIHKQLYLKDTFPGFAPAKIMGSTTQETIEERKKAIVTFLNFVLKNSVLCKARVFQAFFDAAKEKSLDDSPSGPPEHFKAEADPTAAASSDQARPDGIVLD